MPEIGEVARIVHFIRKRLVGKTLAVVQAQHDENVYGKVGTSAAEFEKCMTGKKIEGAGQQGKYFWLEMSSPPHPVIHFGMAGWFKLRDEDTRYHKSAEPADAVWPPKHWKFTFETAEKPTCEAAFVDYRRFGRIRLLDCAREDIRRVTPLKENGPDPVLDRDVVTEPWLAEQLARRKVPIKALLLDQAIISGIGNWVGDEILFNSKIHPEQYSNTLSSAQVSQLHKSLQYVIFHAVDTLVEWDLFPESWLFKHRWNKGKKNMPSRLANGAKIEFVTVGGRTSAVVPSVQKKTGPVAGDVKHKSNEEEDEDMELSEDAEGESKKKKKTLESTRKKADDSTSAPKSDAVKPPDSSPPSTNQKGTKSHANTASALTAIESKTENIDLNNHTNTHTSTHSPSVRKQLASVPQTHDESLPLHPRKSSRATKETTNPTTTPPQAKYPPTSKKRARTQTQPSENEAEAEAEAAKNNEDTGRQAAPKKIKISTADSNNNNDNNNTTLRRRSARVRDRAAASSS